MDGGLVVGDGLGERREIRKGLVVVVEGLLDGTKEMHQRPTHLHHPSQLLFQALIDKGVPPTVVEQIALKLPIQAR